MCKYFYLLFAHVSLIYFQLLPVSKNCMRSFISSEMQEVCCQRSHFHQSPSRTTQSWATQKGYSIREGCRPEGRSTSSQSEPNRPIGRCRRRSLHSDCQNPNWRKKRMELDCVGQRGWKLEDPQLCCLFQKGITFMIRVINLMKASLFANSIKALVWEIQLKCELVINVSLKTRTCSHKNSMLYKMILFQLKIQNFISSGIGWNFFYNK